uniref:Uncharacterized protein n=1 Tax=Heterorhabditis bacteriophora TaxID=37862 RepID=A0A1I7WJP3_HETBA
MGHYLERNFYFFIRTLGIVICIHIRVSTSPTIGYQFLIIIYR